MVTSKHAHNPLWRFVELVKEVKGWRGSILIILVHESYYLFFSASHKFQLSFKISTSFHIHRISYRCIPMSLHTLISKKWHLCPDVPTCIIIYVLHRVQSQTSYYSALCAILIYWLLYGIYMSRFWLICLQCLGIMDYNLENVVFL